MLNEKGKIKVVISNAVLFLLILLWVYAAMSKLLDFTHFKSQMNNQNLTSWLRKLAIYFLPPFELIIALGMTFRKTTYITLWLSFGLLFFFSCYILAVVLHLFSRVPCSCGGILQNMGWLTHFIFNVAFLMLNLYTITVYQRKEVRGE